MSNAQQANAVMAKLPVFYEHNPIGWFINAEAQFALANIVSEKTKFYNAATALSAVTSEEIQHFLQTECGSNSETPYSNLKAELLKVYGQRKTSKMSELMNMTSFNEKGAVNSPANASASYRH